MSRKRSSSLMRVNPLLRFIPTTQACLQNTLNSLYQSHPEQVTQTGDNGYGGLTYSLPKKWVKIAPPRVLSEAQKKVLEDMNRKNKERRQ